MLCPQALILGSVLGEIQTLTVGTGSGPRNCVLRMGFWNRWLKKKRERLVINSMVVGSVTRMLLGQKQL